MSVEKSLSKRIADLAVALELKDLPPKVVWATKKIFLDTVGITLAGTKAPGCRGVVEVVKEVGGEPACAILGYGVKTSPPMAAFANATMGHAFEFDDTHDAAGVHTGSVVVSTALSMGEWKEVSGEELLLSSALGLELFCRLGLACRFPFVRYGYVYTPTLGVFASAATAGKILGFDAEKMVDTIGIAYDMSSGTVISPVEGTLSKRLLAGHAARHGVLAALLAEKGITGPRQALDGKYGYYNVFVKGEYDPDRVLEGFGERFEIPNIGLKPYPSCRYTHAPIEAMFEARSKWGISPEDLESIEIEVDEGSYHICGEPLETKANPRTVVDAQFSIYYTAACALVQGDVFLDDFTPEAIKRPEILKISNKIRLKMSDRIEGAGTKIPGIIATFKKRDGGTLEVRLRHPTDHPLNPISDEKRFRKFRRCAKYGVKSLTDTACDEVIRLTDNLEKLDRVSDLTKILG